MHNLLVILFFSRARFSMAFATILLLLSSAASIADANVGRDCGHFPFADRDHPYSRWNNFASYARLKTTRRQGGGGGGDQYLLEVELPYLFQINGLVGDAWAYCLLDSEFRQFSITSKLSPVETNGGVSGKEEQIIKFNCRYRGMGFR